ncbi:TPA: hypothetical protein ACH3X1_015882 [Trebouxia sp. C0004]
MDRSFTLTRKRHRADESATLKLKRPDLCITTSRALLFKGEDKTSDADLRKAIEELSTKMSNWGANFHGKVEFLLCYACAGPILQFCVLPWGSNIPRFRDVHGYTSWQAAHHCSGYSSVSRSVLSIRKHGQRSADCS